MTTTIPMNAPGGIARAARRAVQAHFMAKMDKSVSDALAAAMWDLHFGPSGGGSEMSYTECLRVLQAWADDELMDVYYDVQLDEVLESEPQGWLDEDDNPVEPLWDEFVLFNVLECRRLLFSTLISEGGF